MKKRNKMSKESQCELWDTIERNYLHFVGIPEEKRTESLFKEIMAGNFPNLGRDFDIHVLAAHCPHEISPKMGSSLRHSTIRLSKKQSTLKAAGRKHPLYIQRNHHNAICGFLNRSFGD